MFLIALIGGVVVSDLRVVVAGIGSGPSPTPTGTEPCRGVRRVAAHLPHTHPQKVRVTCEILRDP